MINPKIKDLIHLEELRQASTIRLIPSENYTSKAVRECEGSVFMNKYSEGYPTKRYYEGQDYTDQIESLAQKEIRKLFGAMYVNVQPYSGSPANLAVYSGLIGPGAKIMGLALYHGGHLTHGYKVSFTSKFFESIQYEVEEDTHLIDYDKLEKLALEHKPNIIVAGATAYPREIDFKRFREIADKVGAYFLADISHISGFVAHGLHSNAIEYAHVTTSTTHKLLRGPRGAVIMTNDEEIAKKIDRALFPGLQGGPHIHTIAGIAQCAIEAQTKEYKEYVNQVKKNAKALEEFSKFQNVKMITDGTDTHLLLLDTVVSFNLSGKEAAVKLYKAGMETNANTIPFDPRKPMDPSGVRIGTPAITTLGAKEEDMKKVGSWMIQALKTTDEQKLASIKSEIVKWMEGRVKSWESN